MTLRQLRARILKRIAELEAERPTVIRRNQINVLRELLCEQWMRAVE